MTACILLVCVVLGEVSEGMPEASVAQQIWQVVCTWQREFPLLIPAAN